jgi:hypothetical protein
LTASSCCLIAAAVLGCLAVAKAAWALLTASCCC